MGMENFLVHVARMGKGMTVILSVLLVSPFMSISLSRYLVIVCN